MIERIKALLRGRGGTVPDSAAAGDDQRQLAVAALLVEAALMDDHFEEPERAKILELLQARFELDDTATEALVATARERVAESAQLFGFTRAVTDRFSAEERIELMEMLWQVAYADGRLDDFEASLMRRVAGLIHVSDRASGEARKRALAKLERVSTKGAASR